MYKTYNTTSTFGVTTRYWDHQNGTTHYQAGDGDSLSRGSTFRGSLRDSFQRGWRRISGGRRGGSRRSRGSGRSGDFYTNQNAATQYMTPV